MGVVVGVRAAATVGLVVVVCLSFGLVAPASAIVGGDATTVASAPWAVFVRVSAGAYEATCSGSILDSRHVLTAAHCLFTGLVTGADVRVKPSQVTVVAGVSNMSQPLPGESAQVRQASRLFVYPGYVPPTYHYIADVDADADVAVIQLATRLELGPGVQGLSLPTADRAHPHGAGYVLAGFGREGRLQGPIGDLRSASFELPEATTVSCCAWFDGLRPCTPTAYLFCGSSPSAAACEGDSGAGLVQGNAVFGVAILDDCSVGHSAMFVDVSAPLIRRFIEDGLSGSQDAVSPRALPTPPGWLTYREYNLTFAAPGNYYVAFNNGQLELSGPTGAIVPLPLFQLFPKHASIRVMNTPSDWSQMESKLIQRAQTNLSQSFSDVTITHRLTTVAGQRAFEIRATYTPKGVGKSVLVSFAFIEGSPAECVGDKLVTGADIPGEHPCTVYVPAQLVLTGAMTPQNQALFARIIASIRFTAKPSSSPAITCLEGDGCPATAQWNARQRGPPVANAASRKKTDDVTVRGDGAVAGGLRVIGSRAGTPKKKPVAGDCKRPRLQRGKTHRGLGGGSRRNARKVPVAPHRLCR
jgi:elastase-2